MSVPIQVPFCQICFSIFKFGHYYDSTYDKIEYQLPHSVAGVSAAFWCELLQCGEEAAQALKRGPRALTQRR